VRFTTEPALECPAEWLDDAIAMANGSQTLMYSSDYPHWDSEEPWVAFKHIDDGLRRKIFRDNALDFLGERLRLVGRTCRTEPTFRQFIRGPRPAKV